MAFAIMCGHLLVDSLKNETLSTFVYFSNTSRKFQIYDWIYD
jgi:hypothetical protein